MWSSLVVTVTTEPHEVPGSNPSPTLRFISQFIWMKWFKNNEKIRKSWIYIDKSISFDNE